MTLEAGAVLGRYRIESLIGRGGMGAVYLATDTQLERRVALKVLSPELTDDERFRARFITESRIAASLDHPNIVPVYEAGEIDGQLFIAMRYIDGHDLSEVLAARGALPIALAVRIVADVAAALDAAHAKGLVHRDVKPGNVLLAGPDEAPHVYLTDFGLTKRLGDASMTAAGQIVGSIGYVAPEQVEGRAVDARTDVYSLGCLTFELLAGAQPFRRDSEMAILMAHVADPPPSLLAGRPELPEALDAAIAQAMAKDPGARFASAGEFAAAVAEAVRPEGGAITRGFLFADLRGYTAYVEGHGDAAASTLLDVYRRMMRDTIAHHGGAEIKTEGDSFYVVFPSASGAVMCGLSVVAAAAAHSHTHPEQPIRVGVGVNAGEAVAAAEGYVGSAVNIAARVCAQAKPGEVLVTDTVRGLTRTSGRLTFTPVGRRTLKGIAEPVALFRAEPAGSGLLLAPGGAGPWWRRPAVLAGMGGLAVLTLAVVLVKGGFGPATASPSASASAAPSLPPPVPVERIAYTQVRSRDPNSPATCDFTSEGRAVLLDPAGGVPVRVTHGGDAAETNLAWSPDGSALAFIGYSQEYAFGVDVMNVATGQTSQLLPDTPPAGLEQPTYIDSVSWSRDGTSVVFAEGPKIWVVGADGTGLHELGGITMPPNPVPTSSGGVEPIFEPRLPVWLPDGRIAALLLRTDVYSGTIAIAPAGGGQLAPVGWIPAGLNVIWMAWSLDGSRVAFVGADATQSAADEWDMYVANADGSSLNKLVTSLHPFPESGPAWSPDGTRIVYGISGKLYIVDASGGTSRELPGTVGRAACWPSWGRPTTAALPQPTPTLAPGATAPPSPFHDGLLDPGVYDTEVFKPRMRFAVGPGWDGTRNYLDYLVLELTDIQGAGINVVKVQVGLLTSCSDSPTQVVKDPRELVEFLQAHPNLDASDVSPINILGVSGLSVEVSVSALPTEADCPGQSDFPPQIPIVQTGTHSGYGVDAADRVKVIALTIDGEGLVAFFLEAPKDQFLQFQLLAQQILDTLTFP